MLRESNYGEMYLDIVNELIQKLKEHYTYEDVYVVLESMMLKFDPKVEKIESHSYQDRQLLDVFFEKIFTMKGIEWLSNLEPLVRRLASEYNISMPEIYGLSLKKVELQAAELALNIEKLKKENERLRSVVKDTEEKMLRDPITLLYNMNCFNNFMATEVKRQIINSSEEGFSLISISIDNLSKIKYLYGDSEVDEVLRNTAYLLQGINNDCIMIFRLQGSTFAITVCNMTKKESVALAEKIRNRVANFEGFIEGITASLGVVTLNELLNLGDRPEKIASDMYEVVMTRLGIAKNEGMNLVCSESDIIENDVRIGKVLLVDSDKTNTDFLKSYLEYNNFKVFTAADGLAAYDLVQSEKPDVIVSDIMLPKMDGFSFRQKLIDDSLTKNSLFIFLSHLKDEDAVKRALSLDVDFYFKKPYMVVEIVGIIKNRMKGVTLR